MCSPNDDANVKHGTKQNIASIVVSGESWVLDAISLSKGSQSRSERTKELCLDIRFLS
jgi:hypothetical protein